MLNGTVVKLPTRVEALLMLSSTQPKVAQLRRLVLYTDNVLRTKPTCGTESSVFDELSHTRNVYQSVGSVATVY